MHLYTDHVNDGRLIFRTRSYQYFALALYIYISQGASIISGQTLGTKYSGTYDADDSTYQDDEDNYLLQQAMAAARAIHHVQGVEYDKTQDINGSTDIKFVVATVSLPLGCESLMSWCRLLCYYFHMVLLTQNSITRISPSVLFQEHEIGVWVSRVVPDGNGAKKGFQHGDQLAAINGNSSVHTTIDEVSSTISGGRAWIDQIGAGED